MNRLASAVRVDLVIQWRNRLVFIGLGVGLLVASMMAWLTPSMLLMRVVPSVMLAVIGGSTLMYIGGMLVFERDERTLAANIVSPLRAGEYLWAKVITLGFLATIESFTIVIGCVLAKSLVEQLPVPNLFPLSLGIIAMSVMYTLAGFILVVRFRSINEFLIPMAVVASVAQLPIFYFLALVESWVLLVIPTGAPAMLIRGAFTDLSGAQWMYGITYSLMAIGTMAVWAHHAYMVHVIQEAG